MCLSVSDDPFSQPHFGLVWFFFFFSPRQFVAGESFKTDSWRDCSPLLSTANTQHRHNLVYYNRSTRAFIFHAINCIAVKQVSDVTTSVLPMQSMEVSATFSLNIRKGPKKAKASSSNSWIRARRFTFQLTLYFIQSLMPETEILTVAVAYFRISWKQVWASPPLTVCLRPPSTSQMVVPSGQQCLLT